MGVMSRNVLSACGRLCFFCLSMRTWSRHPVKRYKKNLADIFLRHRQMSEDVGSQYYTPPISEDKKPKIRQQFLTIEEGYNFYNSYAKECGFSVRMNNSKRKKETNEIVWKQFVCYKEGEKNDNYQKNQKDLVQRSGERDRGGTRVGCKAKMNLVKEQIGSNWSISHFVEEHNHVLATPRKIHILRSHRDVSSAKRVLTQQLSEANIPTCQQIRVMEIESGGPHSIGCIEKDIRNFKQGIKKDVEDIDAELLIEFFSSEKEKNSSFYFSYELDEEKKLVRCFWSDPTARKAYNYFGDAIVFDTTYNTNRYDMIFALLAGVNHHGQTIIFGCGLLTNERTESFIWLFNQFLDVMPKGAPQLIITDQDPGMTKAIFETLPSTCHRYCIWHILNKFSEKIGAISYRDYYDSFKDVIFNSETVEEFETCWADLLSKCKLEKNDWLCSMYEIRSKWVPTYLNNLFSAGMSSSQRAESSHAFFKKYISKKNSLMDFIIRFNRALSHQRHEETVADHVDINEEPKLKTLSPMEKQMAKLYTKKNFKFFQNEMFESSAYFSRCTYEDDISMFYSVEMATTSSSSRNRRLTYDKHSDFVSCSCKLFDFKGIPCRHIFAFFRVIQVVYLPEKYILTRWTKNAKVGGVLDNKGQEISDQYNTSLMTRHAQLSHASSALVDYASLTMETTDYILDEFKLLHDKVKKMNDGKVTVTIPVCKRSKDVISINNPSRVRAKGCGKRLKSSKERATPKFRLCKGCGLRGQQHDKRNCPKLQDRSTTNDEESNLESSTEDDD